MATIDPSGENGTLSFSELLAAASGKTLGDENQEPAVAGEAFSVLASVGFQAEAAPDFDALRESSSSSSTGSDDVSDAVPAASFNILSSLGFGGEAAEAEDSTAVSTASQEPTPAFNLASALGYSEEPSETAAIATLGRALGIEAEEEPKPLPDLGIAPLFVEEPLLAKKEEASSVSKQDETPSAAASDSPSAHTDADAKPERLAEEVKPRRSRFADIPADRSSRWPAKKEKSAPEVEPQPNQARPDQTAAIARVEQAKSQDSVPAATTVATTPSATAGATATATTPATAASSSAAATAATTPAATSTSTSTSTTASAEGATKQAATSSQSAASQPETQLSAHKEPMEQAPSSTAPSEPKPAEKSAQQQEQRPQQAQQTQAPQRDTQQPKAAQPSQQQQAPATVSESRSKTDAAAAKPTPRKASDAKSTQPVRQDEEQAAGNEAPTASKSDSVESRKDKQPTIAHSSISSQQDKESRTETDKAQGSAKQAKPTPAKAPASKIYSGEVDASTGEKAAPPVKPLVKEAKKKSKFSRTQLKVLGVILVIVALALAGYAAFMFVSNSNLGTADSAKDQSSQTTNTNDSESNTVANGPSSVTYQYTVSGPTGVLCTATEVAEFDATNTLTQSTITTELPDNALAKQFLEETHADFGSTFVEGSVEGSKVTVVIDESGQRLKKEAYTELLMKNAASCQIISG